MEKRIGFGLRFVAMLIDMIIISVIAWIVGPIIGGLVGMGSGGMAGGGEAGMMMGMVAGILASITAVYLVGMIYMLIEGFTGASPGKMVLKLKIGTLDGKAGDTSLYMKRWAIKNIGYILGTLGLIVTVIISAEIGGILGTVGSIGSLIILLGCFMMFGAKKQALHDVLGGTAVYRKADLT